MATKKKVSKVAPKSFRTLMEEAQMEDIKFSQMCRKVQEIRNEERHEMEMKERAFYLEAAMDKHYIEMESFLEITDETEELDATSENLDAAELESVEDEFEVDFEEDFEETDEEYSPIKKVI